MVAKRYQKVAGKTPAGVSGQAKQVWEVLGNDALTYKEVARKLEAHPNFTTAQTPERIAAYYICVFHKRGYLQQLDDKLETEDCYDLMQNPGF
jgi:hypothetical protein